MNEMVERVAQVLRPHFSDSDRAYNYQAAREVIAAMREPTSRMMITLGER